MLGWHLSVIPPILPHPIIVIRSLDGSTEYPADHGAAMLAYLTRDLVALAEIHRDYYSSLVSSMGTAIDDAVRWFLDNADDAYPPRPLQ